MLSDKQRLFIHACCGTKNDRVYRSWTDAKQRCENPNNKDFKRYGGRGIKMKLSYLEFKNLWIQDKAWLLKNPTIDRIDNDGDYIIKNCQFIEKSINSGKDKKKKLKR